MPQFLEKEIETYVKLSRGDLSGYWFDAYGWIACYFAQLEGLSYALVDLLSSREETPRLNKLPFQARTERARELICNHLRRAGKASLADEWDALLQDAISAAPLRNKILHNPLSVNLAIGDPLHDKDAGIILIHEAGQKVLKLDLVQKFAESMRSLNTRMQDLLVRTQINQDPRLSE